MLTRALVFSAVTALGVSFANAASRPGSDFDLTRDFTAQAVFAAAEVSLGRPMTGSEREAVFAEARALAPLLQQTEDASIVRVQAMGNSASGPIVTDVYICVGGLGAAVVVGIQGLRCARTRDGRTMAVGFSSDSLSSALSGALAAQGFVGLTGGIAGSLGVLIHRHPSYEPAYRGGPRPLSVFDRDVVRSRAGSAGDEPGTSVQGGMANGSRGLLGAMIGYFQKENESVQIYAWQAGWAAQLSASVLSLSWD